MNVTQTEAVQYGYQTNQNPYEYVEDPRTPGRFCQRWEVLQIELQRLKSALIVLGLFNGSY